MAIEVFLLSWLQPAPSSCPMTHSSWLIMRTPLCCFIVQRSAERRITSAMDAMCRCCVLHELRLQA